MKPTLIISESPRKNIRQGVYHNVDANGKIQSITRHEPLDPTKPHYRRFQRGDK